MLCQKIVIFVYLCWLPITVANTLNNFEKFSIPHTNTSDFTRGFQNLVERIQTENSFDSYFLLRNQPDDCVDEQLPLNFALPSMQLNESETIYVHGSGNNYLLAILCIDKLTNKDVLLRFALDLQHTRTRPVLAIHNGNLAASAQSDIEFFFRNCMEMKFLHVILIHRDFGKTNVYHSFNQFPDFELETRNLLSTSPIYPFRSKNMRRKKLRILVDQIVPTTLLYEVGEKLILEGYIGYFLKTFASKYNFRLWLPEEYESSIKHMISMEEIRRATRNDSIDVGASLLTPQKEENLHEYSYPVEFFQWLTMLPVEPPLEIYYFFIKIYSPSCLIGLFFIAYCLCVVFALEVKIKRRNFHSNRSLLALLIIPWDLDLLRGLFNQSTAMHLDSATRRMIFLLIFALGGTVNSFFSTKMVNWLTVPPRIKPIKNFSDVTAHNLKIKIAASYIPEVKLYRGENFWKEYNHIFIVEKSLEDLHVSIRKLDFRYAYTMNTLAWPIIQQGQMYFKNPVFRLSDDLYYTKGSLLSLPVSQNFMFKSILNDFCIRSREIGLLEHWHKMTFFTLLSLGRFQLKDPSDKVEHKFLTLKEFEWLWIAYGIGMGLSVLTFLAESIWFKYS